MFHYFPIQAFVFPDGIYVINAAPEYHAMIGKKIISIGEHNIGQIEKLMLPLINRTSEIYSRKEQYVIYDNHCRIPEWFGYYRNPFETVYTSQVMIKKQKPIQ